MVLTFQRACSVVWAAIIKVSKRGRSSPPQETHDECTRGRVWFAPGPPAASTPKAGCSSEAAGFVSTHRLGAGCHQSGCFLNRGKPRGRSRSGRLCWRTQGVVTNVTDSHAPGGEPLRYNAAPFPEGGLRFCLPHTTAWS